MLDYRLRLFQKLCNPLVPLLTKTDTLVTFFSGTNTALEPLQQLSKDHDGEPADLRTFIFHKLSNHPRYPTKINTVFDFLALVVLMSISVMLEKTPRSSGEYVEGLDVFVAFEKYITKQVEL